MKAVILAGGFGTRISEETHLIPKPMIEIGNKPILWHIMKIYSTYGINEFIVCCGYKGHKIKEYFSNYQLCMSDLTINLKENKIEINHSAIEPWIITLVDTGEKTMTGGRLKRIRNYINNESFLFTYGDGLADININHLIDHHKSHNRLATITAIQPPGRYGLLEINNKNEITKIVEKPHGDGGWINGGFFVLEPEVFELIDDDSCIWERDPLENLVSRKQLSLYKHNGFWHPMDTLRDKRYLENLWSTNPPWKSW